MDSATPRDSERRVRFSESDNVREDDASVNEESFPAWSPPPPTPSPTHSVSTESSGGLFTPPSPDYMMLESKGSFPLNPTATPKFHPSLSSASLISWDMSEPPVPRPEASEIAATVSRDPLTIFRLKNNAIPEWPLEIKGNAGLTVMEVQSALHQHLKKDVDEAYYMRQSPEVRTAASKAFQRREKPEGTGLQRIDFLPGRIFQGLRIKAGSAASSDGVWEFRFDVGSGASSLGTSV